MTVREFSAKQEALLDITCFAEETLEAAECPMKTQMQVTLVIEEVFINIVNYAYPGSEGSMLFGMDTTDGLLTMTFTDYGVPFNPLEREDPDINLAADERDIGGLGIYLVKQTMDDISYEYRDNSNILTVYKRFFNPQASDID